ncbi:MAG: TipC family immunity protein [Lachnospiraceae bacterium]|nr:TipC family immunity protein [Lachnospiraceae bacterium]
MDRRIKVLKLLFPIGMCLFLVFYNLRTNVLEQIAESKMYGLVKIPEVVGVHDAWEWYVGLETFGALEVNYKEEYLDENVKEIGLHFSADDNNIGITIIKWMSGGDSLRMMLYANYDYTNKVLEYEPIEIVQREGEDCKIYTDSKSIRQYMSKCNITEEDVEDYYEYAIYDVIVRTWTKRYRQFYWLEKWKLERCTIDNSFAFEETAD